MREGGRRLVRCPRCGVEFECRHGAGEQCWCVDHRLPEGLGSYLALHYRDCLCEDCLDFFESHWVDMSVGLCGDLREEYPLAFSRGAGAERGDYRDGFARLVEVVDVLRAYCPWDREQTFSSLRVYSVEEVYELVDALEGGEARAIVEELGDILMHLLFYAAMGREGGLFDLNDVFRALLEKLVYRHPHVFGRERTDDAREVEIRWERLKQLERRKAGVGSGVRGVLAGVPGSLPAWVKGMRIQEKASAVGFDWTEREAVWGKVREELDEVLEVVEAGAGGDLDEGALMHELGDLQFALLNASRLYGVDAVDALEGANRRFIRRFERMEALAGAEGGCVGRHLDEKSWDALWERAKASLRAEGAE